MNEILQKLEAFLFVSGEPVAFVELAKRFNVSMAALQNHLVDLRQELEGHGLDIVTTDTHVQLVTASAVAEFLATFAEKEHEELSRAAAETLTIIAYRGPISRSEVDAIRGVDSRRMIRQLIHRGVLRQIQQSGRVPLYDVSSEFFQTAGITQRDELPEFETLSKDENIERILNQQDT